jgi:hypothetical protein
MIYTSENIQKTETWEIGSDFSAKIGNINLKNTTTMISNTALRGSINFF